MDPQLGSRGGNLQHPFTPSTIHHPLLLLLLLQTFHPRAPSLRSLLCDVVALGGVLSSYAVAAAEPTLNDANFTLVSEVFDNVDTPATVRPFRFLFHHRFHRIGAGLRGMREEICRTKFSENFLAPFMC